MNSPGANLKRQQRVWLASLAMHKPPEIGRNKIFRKPIKKHTSPPFLTGDKHQIFVPGVRKVSSVGQSTRLITDRSWVRVPDFPFPISNTSGVGRSVIHYSYTTPHGIGTVANSYCPYRVSIFNMTIEKILYIWK